METPTKQPNLFSYPNSPGYQPRDTSIAAAEAVKPTAESLRSKAYRVLQAREATADEVAEVLNESPFTMRPRVAELAKLGKIEDTGRRSLNRSGKKAIVWRIKQQ